jgi:hypothetical protein
MIDTERGISIIHIEIFDNNEIICCKLALGINILTLLVSDKIVDLDDHMGKLYLNLNTATYSDLDGSYVITSNIDKLKEEIRNDYLILVKELDINIVA